MVKEPMRLNPVCHTEGIQAKKNWVSKCATKFSYSTKCVRRKKETTPLKNTVHRLFQQKKLKES